ncbi:uncharacterized protein LOC108114793 [Drosophila eugracilis]|uniref:uncharacterized protein LOC108114793 n=1 Tax=Drosophila eugracilis TaxID=29029 RepID=UPI001BDB101E|nr:uncharacterized protein LOC108114793 [Drosophila eugracilis]
MTHPFPILLACFVHLVLHTALFVQLDPVVFEGTPILGSQIFYLSVMDLLCHCEVIPSRWNKVPPWGKSVLETIVAFLIGEISMFGIWFTIETIFADVIIMVTYNTDLKYSFKLFLLEISTVMIAIAFSMGVAAVTNKPVKMQKLGRQILSFTKNFKQAFFFERKESSHHGFNLSQKYS